MTFLTAKRLVSVQSQKDTGQAALELLVRVGTKYISGLINKILETTR
jgi:hypothetical protein